MAAYSIWENSPLVIAKKKLLPGNISDFEKNVTDWNTSQLVFAAESVCWNRQCKNLKKNSCNFRLYFYFQEMHQQFCSFCIAIPLLRAWDDISVSERSIWKLSKTRWYSQKRNSSLRFFIPFVFICITIIGHSNVKRPKVEQKIFEII